ncbi:MAG: group II intron maturase-specific domain-containing protein [Lautropia sp.]|nr:group II intron maturase-specific domain-containing protein [Lautropia sp.]
MSERPQVAEGEARGERGREETACPRHEDEGAGSALLEAMLTRENLKRAWKRVRANKGAAGVDGLDIEQTARQLVNAWPMIRQQLRQLTRRSGGRSLPQVIERLRGYLLGWRNYFGLAQTPSVWQKLDEWLRHRLRCIQLKQWKRGKTIYRELIAMGAPPWLARKVPANSRRWWRNSGMALNGVLSIQWFDRLGLPRLS